MIQRRVTVLCLMSYSPRVAHAHNARIPKSSTYVSHSFREINLPSSQCLRSACPRTDALFASAMSYAAAAPKVRKIEIFYFSLILRALRNII